MKRRRRRSHRRRNPVPNPKTADLILLAGVVGVAGLGIWHLNSQNAATTPVASTLVNGTAVALNSSGKVIPTTSLTPAQQGALAAQQQAAAAANLANQRTS